MTLSFDDLFALRIYYLDEFEDEVEVIKKLKLRLLETNMSENEINKYLSDFYKNAGIEITEEAIAEIIIPNSNFVFIPINTINNQINNFLQSLNNFVQQDVLNNLEDIKVTVKTEELEKFTKIKLDKDEENCCSICLCEYKKDEEKIILKCNHDYHYECIKKWLEEYNYKCPVCRCETTETKNINLTNQEIDNYSSHNSDNSENSDSSDNSSDI